jgi:23S rRNA (pseudouridine1915-N3)-methyltransferase
MTWRIITVGKPAFAWARVGADAYLERLQKQTRIEHHIIREGPRAQVEEQMLAASAKSLRVMLDERGKALRSLELARWIEARQMDATKCVSLLIGGAEGHSEAFRQQADVLWTLSSYTLQHEVALVVLLEQLYRAHTILHGEPYHRE